MKKNEYVSPEMEIVEITEQYNIMGASGTEDGNGNVSGDLDSGNKWGGFDDDDD